MPTLAETIRQFTLRYRAALIRRAVVWSVLGVVVVALLGWWLHQLPLAPRLRAGLPAGAALAGLAALAWWLKRRWISPEQSAASLDRTLGLQDRLVTVAEFAKVTPPPALYALLEEDARRSLDPSRLELPRAFDRTSLILALVILFLLILPVGGRSPLRQLASLPKEFRSRPPEQPPQSSPDQPRQQHEQGGGAKQQAKPTPSQGPSSPQDQSQQNSSQNQQANSGQSSGPQPDKSSPSQ